MTINRWGVILKPKPVKAIFFIVVIALLLSACKPTYPLKGKTAKGISEIRSGKPVEATWSGAISFFIANGYTIKDTDRNNGLIVTGKYNFGHHFSFVLHGEPLDTTAWIALSYIRLRGGFGDNPIKVSAEWRVTITPDGTGSILKMNLKNVYATVHIPPKRTFHPDADYTFTGISTGVFEKMMGDAIK